VPLVQLVALPAPLSEQIGHVEATGYVHPSTPCLPGSQSRTPQTVARPPLARNPILRRRLAESSRFRIAGVRKILLRRYWE
jgi:hypothetical protein